MSWKLKNVRNVDGRTGVISVDAPGFAHRGLHIKCEDGSTGYVQLNADGQDSGDRGWEWFCEGFDRALGGPCWIALGDHNGPEMTAHPRHMNA
ncbi:hypothetical protein [Alicycliphilus denitrificans]|uniref:hypothetical protein n=1 Tax=Alicycliphilus denitrificans TaxID=179636 RepID=UPI0011D24521|nr:hypothetical protein [Alicycliphilus denitrificans]